MKKSLFIFILLIPLLVFARQEADSLQNILKTLPQGKEKVSALNRLTFLLREIDVDQALRYGEQAEKIAFEVQDSVGLGRAKGNIGWIHYRKGNWEKAFRYSKNAYEIGISQNDNSEIAMVLNNLGALYYQQKNYPEAIQKFKEAYALGLKLNDPYITIRSLNNIALNYKMAGELDSALFYAQLALTKNEEAGSIYFNSFTNRVIGDVQLEKGEIEQAIDTYENSLEVASHQQLKSFEASILHRLGRAYLLQGESNRAIAVLKKGLDISLENGYRDELAQTYKHLAAAYEKTGNISSAYQYQKSFLELNEILEEESDKDRLALIQGMFEEEKSNTELRYLQTQNELNEARLQSVQRLAWIIGIAAVLFVIMLFWLLILNRRTKAINENLRIEQEKVNLQKKELEIRSEELAESNKTKNLLFSILSHDLRSPVGQLKGVMDLLQTNELSKEEFDEISGTLKRDVDALFINLDNMLIWSRAQMEGFKIKKKKLNLKKVIKPCMELFQHQAFLKNIKFVITITEDAVVYADKDLMQVIIRNLISNALKFSNKNDTIEIYIDSNDQMVSLNVRDHGVGMTEEQINTIMDKNTSIINSSIGTQKEKGTGLGLNICKEFTAMMGGEFQVESEKGEGTIASISLPIVIKVS